MKKGKQYKFKINAYTPDTLPLARCADYLHELADIFGESPHVHFMKIIEGSTQLVAKVEHEAVPKVEERINAIERGNGPASSMKAYDKINKMLMEDNGTGAILRGRAKILKFPGKKEDIIKPMTIQQPGEIVGELNRVGGSRDIVHITINSEENDISSINVKREIAKDLAKHLFEQVKLIGNGRWERNVEGVWNLISFTVDSFEVLEDIPLSQTVLELRGIKGEWKKDVLSEILESRKP